MATALRDIAARRAAAARAAAALMVAVALAGCYTPRETAETIPNDYRQRHPITIGETEHSLAVFVGTRPGLTPAQRADVLAFAQSWKRDAAGGISIDLPSGTPNARAAEASLREMQSILAAAEVPQPAVRVRSFRPVDAAQLPPIKMAYPRIGAQAGPCGLWPKDLGPDTDPLWEENRPYYNLGCASQHNLAAMVENPADLVQPRAETPAYEPRRSQALEKYRTGQSPATTYPNPNQGKISDVGQQ